MVALSFEGFQLLSLGLGIKAICALLLAGFTLMLTVLLQQRLLHAGSDGCLGYQSDVFGWRKALPLPYSCRTAQILLETERVAASLLSRFSFLLFHRLGVGPCSIVWVAPPEICCFFVGGVGVSLVVVGSAISCSVGCVVVPVGLEWMLIGVR